MNITGCDFVFEPDYKLLSIPALADYIKMNKHLPDVQPASEMETNGINVAEMQSKLLQKVEEQTLYIIDLNKRMEKLEKENGELKKQIEK